MTFEDLPARASEIPLTDRRVAADVIDLILSDSDRAAGCVGVMICDAEDRGVQPIVLHDVPPDAAAGDFVRLLDLLLPLVADDDGSLLIGRGRAHGTAPTDVDRAWHELAIARCAAHDVGLLGFYLATGDGVFRLPDALSAAS
ncbi:hypothetical protein GCM10009868_12180 [Terrabacter aerolatus]|uniref:RadC-like JAB domain-containing protein n=1 Tax=Terrabacter aerolatus TaxID=422442 RepID=A0A512CY00_9MICO|nr:hypothetical protein [Terrabacter aerolatus]GEO29074.1 hypothetical protein TAE01_08840 [Terrabacter aerolatus]